MPRWPKPGGLPARRRASMALALFAAAFGSSCGADTSIVELDWAFVDTDGVPIFPGGAILQNRDTCALEGRDETGTKRYALNVSLVIEDTRCLEDLDAGTIEDASACEIAREQFDCDRARGAITGVPTSEEPYLMRVEVWADPSGSDDPPFEVDPTCIAAPGPRTRSVLGGRITDLAVYQLVAHAIDLDDSASGRLDLPGCRLVEVSPEPEPGDGGA